MDPLSTDTAEFQPRPRKIGRYQIVDELGRGGMGVVYKGFDPTIGRTVAIKTVHVGAGSEEILKRFRREAQAAGLLSHPNIVTIYDAGEERGIFYIAMEYVEGETLEKVIQRGAVPVEQAIAITADVGSALDLAHLQDVIHRDIKPANIMIARGHAKVMDFGVARIAASTATATGTVIGTPAYMSPESVSGKTVDGRSDIFSLGVVLYEMLTAKRPFAGESIPSVIYRIISEQPPLPTAINPQLHNALDWVLMKALSKNPADRYQSCAAFVADLRAFRTLDAASFAAPRPGAAPAPLHSPGVASTQPAVWGTVAMEAETVAAAPPAKPIPHAPKRSRAPIFAAGFLVAALAVGGGLWWSGARQRNEARDAVKQQALHPGLPSPAVPSPAIPAPAIPAPAVTGLEVLIESDVKGASIKIDGKTKPDWLTPKRLHLAEGKHEVSVEKSGYQPATKTLRLTAKGPKALKVTLAAETVDIEITSTPDDAQVFIDSIEQDAHTPSRYNVAHGEHTFEVQKTGFGAEIRSMKVDGSTRGFSVALKREAGTSRRGRTSTDMSVPPPGVQIPVPGVGFDAKAMEAIREAYSRSGVGAAQPLQDGEGYLYVRTVPSRASFTVDGKPEAHVSPKMLALPAGKHTVVVKPKTGDPVTKEAEVRAGRRADLNVVLIKDPKDAVKDAPKQETPKQP